MPVKVDQLAYKPLGYVYFSILGARITTMDHPICLLAFNFLEIKHRASCLQDNS